MLRGSVRLVTDVVGVLGVVAGVDGALERPGVDHERQDDLAGVQEHQHQELARRKHDERRCADGTEHEQNQVHDEDHGHRQGLFRVVHAGLRHPQKFGHGEDGAEDVEDLHPGEGVRADRRENRANVVDGRIDDRVNRQQQGERRHAGACPPCALARDASVALAGVAGCVGGTGSDCWMRIGHEKPSS